MTNAAEYLPSALNIQADLEAHFKAESLEWKLNLAVFQKKYAKMGTPWIDLIESRMSHQLLMYADWRQDPYSMATNAFLVT